MIGGHNANSCTQRKSYTHPATAPITFLTNPMMFPSMYPRTIMRSLARDRYHRNKIGFRTHFYALLGASIEYVETPIACRLFFRPMRLRRLLDFSQLEERAVY
jgi:hypothetical protein